MKQKHTTKKGPGRCHVDGTNRGSTRMKEDAPSGFPGAKLERRAFWKTITLRT